MQSGNGFLRFFVIWHFNKAKAPGLSGYPIIDDLNFMDFSVIRKHELKDGFIRTGGQVFHKNIQDSNVLLYKLNEKQKSSVEAREIVFEFLA